MVRLRLSDFYELVSRGLVGKKTHGTNGSEMWVVEVAGRLQDAADKRVYYVSPLYINPSGGESKPRKRAQVRMRAKIQL